MTPTSHGAAAIECTAGPCGGVCDDCRVAYARDYARGLRGRFSRRLWLRAEIRRIRGR